MFSTSTTQTTIKPVAAQTILVKVVLLIKSFIGIVAFACSSQGSVRFSLGLKKKIVLHFKGCFLSNNQRDIDDDIIFPGRLQSKGKKRKKKGFHD